MSLELNFGRYVLEQAHFKTWKPHLESVGLKVVKSEDTSSKNLEEGYIESLEARFIYFVAKSVDNSFIIGFHPALEKSREVEWSVAQLAREKLLTLGREVTL